MEHGDKRADKRHADEPVVHTVTSAASSTTDDQSERIRKYLIMMGIRIACFLAVPFTTGWVRWTCVGAAIVLPYIAVITANAVRPSQAGTVSPVTPLPDQTRQIRS